MKNIIKISSMIFLLACSSGPQPIQYGKDNCDFCKMTIMDHKFGTEIITKKGKTFKFDSDECLRQYFNEATNATEFTSIYVTDYATPGTLTDGKVAFYLYGPKVKSPMGGNLAAFAKKSDAEKVQKTLGGDILSWDQMIKLE